MATNRPARTSPPGAVPLISVEGTAHECGRMLGYVWTEQLRRGASTVAQDSRPWWRHKPYQKLIDHIAPHLPDVYRGMAKTSGVPEQFISTRVPDGGGCTSFAISGTATLDGDIISGQTKDTPEARLYQFQVLRMKMSDAPSAMSLTYEGWLFGHGFVQGGCSIFRNSLYAGSAGTGIPYGVWGMLALHCKNVEEVMKLTRDHGNNMGSHACVADSHGGIIGIEFTAGGVGFCKPKRGIYAHANAVVASKRLLKHENPSKIFHRTDSLHRGSRLRELLEANRGRLTPQLAYAAMTDHDGHPISVCRHQGAHAMTTACVVVEPNKGLLHATRGNPCQNWPVTYSL